MPSSMRDFTAKNDSTARSTKYKSPVLFTLSLYALTFITKKLKRLTLSQCTNSQIIFQIKWWTFLSTLILLRKRFTHSCTNSLIPTAASKHSSHSMPTPRCIHHHLMMIIKWWPLLTKRYILLVTRSHVTPFHSLIWLCCTLITRWYAVKCHKIYVSLFTKIKSIARILFITNPLTNN